MADEPQATPQAETPKVEEPKAEVPKAEGTPTISTKDIEGKTPDEIVKFVSEQSEKHGVTKKQLEDYENYIKQIKPYIDTITEDPKLTEQVEDAYRKKFNIEAPKEDKKPETIADDTRLALANDYVRAFERDHGLDKLEGDAKKDMNVRVGQQLMAILDSTGKKTYNQVVDEIPLNQLQSQLERAYRLATYDEQIAQAKQSAQAEAQAGSAGIISSVPSNSPNAPDATLSPVERELAKRMGVTDEKWLERKKQINSRNEGR